MPSLIRIGEQVFSGHLPSKVQAYVTRHVTFGPNAQMTSQSKMTSKKCINLLCFLREFLPARKTVKYISVTKFFTSHIYNFLFAKLSY